jgi:hypothetical protein
MLTTVRVSVASYIIIIIIIIILTANVFLPCGSGTTIGQHTNNTPHSKKPQHTKLHK